MFRRRSILEENVPTCSLTHLFSTLYNEVFSLYDIIFSMRNDKGASTKSVVQSTVKLIITTCTIL